MTKISWKCSRGKASFREGFRYKILHIYLLLLEHLFYSLVSEVD